MSTVSVTPLLMTTVSLEFGRPPAPDPPVRLLQFLLVVTVMVAALAVEAPRSMASSVRSDSVRQARHSGKRKEERRGPKSEGRGPRIDADGVLWAKCSCFIAPLLITSLPRRQLVSG